MILFRPVDKSFRITQLFGENPDHYPTTNGHNGIDFGLPEGNPVMATADGVVTRAELDTSTAANPKVGYGYHVRILHSNGWTSIYAHFQQDSFAVETGDQVTTGTIIGRSGNTGMSTGPHLHFEVRKGVGVLSGIDPLPLLVDEIPSKDTLFVVTVVPEGDGVRLRDLPRTSHSHIIKNLRTGDSREVLGLDGNDVWLRVKDGYIMYNPKWYKIEKKDE